MISPQSRLAETIRRDIDKEGEALIPIVVLAAVFSDGDRSRLKLGDMEVFAAAHGWVVARAIAGEGLTFRPVKSYKAGPFLIRFGTHPQIRPTRRCYRQLVNLASFTRAVV